MTPRKSDRRTTAVRAPCAQRSRLAGYAAPFGTACSASFGSADLAAYGSLQFGMPVVFASGNHAPNSIGLTILGLSSTNHLGMPLPLSVDPIFGTSGCSLYTDILATDLTLTSAASPAVLSTTYTPCTWPSPSSSSRRASSPCPADGRSRTRCKCSFPELQFP